MVFRNFVRPDEAEKVKSKIRELGQYTVIDKIAVKLNEKKDYYEAEFSNLGLKGVTVANLFYNMASKKVGLVGLWDAVAFDEVAGITFKDKDGIQIMKDYMASGSFARGREEKNASASMVFVGNINKSVDVLLKTLHLFIHFLKQWKYLDKSMLELDILRARKGRKLLNIKL